MSASSPYHTPFGMDEPTTPFGTKEEKRSYTPETPTTQRAQQQSASDGTLSAAAASARPPELSPAAMQRRLSDAHTGSLTNMESSAQHSPSLMSLPGNPLSPPPSPSPLQARRSPRRVPLTSSPPGSGGGALPPPSPPLPLPLSRPVTRSLDSTLLLQLSSPLVRGASITTLPPTTTKRKAVGFASPAGNSVTIAPAAEPVANTDSSSASTEAHAASPVPLAEGREGRPVRGEPQHNAARDASTPPPPPRRRRRSSAAASTHTVRPKEDDAAFALSTATAIYDAAADEPTSDRQSEDGADLVKDERDTESDGASQHSPSPHARRNTVYTNLSIQKPNTSETADTFVAGAHDPEAEAQIRAAGTSGSALLFPVHDRAKQVLLSPGPATIGTPRLRHGPGGSKGGESTPRGGNAAGGGGGTPRSALSRPFTMLITPLLRTPMHRRQSSGINSPLVVDREVLEEPAHSPATFGARLAELDEHAGGNSDHVTTHMVWQMREGLSTHTFSPSFLVVSAGDRVCIHWYDSAEEVFETDRSYLNVIPGGRHSCYNSTTPVTDRADALTDTVEMGNVWMAPQSGSLEPTSHALGRQCTSLSLSPTIAQQQQESRDRAAGFGGGGGVGGQPRPSLVIQAHAPQLTHTDSLANTMTLPDLRTATPVLSRQGGQQQRRLASEVVAARDGNAFVGDDGVEEEEAAAANLAVSMRSDNARGQHTHTLSATFNSRLTGFNGVHSRQLSTSWMLQPAASRRTLGDNYQSFTVAFTKPGDYYFVSSKHKRSMRLHVQVSSKRSIVAWRFVFAGVAAIVVVALVVVVVVVLAYWMHHSTYLFGESETATYEQYLAFLDIHDLITVRLFPFLATGVLIVLLVVLGAIGWAVYRCFRPASQGSFTRGIYFSTRRILQLGTILLTAALIVLLFVAYGLELNVTNGFMHLATSIGSGVTSTLNLFSTAVVQVNYVVTEAETLLPNVTLPTAQILKVTSQVSDLMSTIVSWTAFVEDIAQVAFRVIPIILFLSMQLGLFAACLTIGALILNFRKAAVATTWMLAISLGVFAILCGVEFTITQLFSTIYTSVVVLRDDPASFGATLGLADDSFVSQLLSYCTLTVDDVSEISKLVTGMLQAINASLDSEAQKEFGEIFSFLQEVVPDTLQALVNYTDYIAANLDNVQSILDNSAYQVDELLRANVVPMIKAVVSILQTLEGLVNCQVIRDIVATAIPVFQNEVQNYNLAVFSFLLIIFGVSFLLLVFSVGSTYALRHPRKTWCNMRTGRWFRFRYSYKTHIATLLQGASAKATERTALQWLVYHTEPIMARLRTVKLVCYASCALMFFDSILIVLFNEVSRGTQTSKLLKAQSYLGCAVLFFLLVAALFRRAFLRWIFHACSLLCAAACLGLSVSQALVGFVHFGQCISHSRYEMGSLTSGSPVYLTCSATYMGYNLEVAIYAVVLFLNSITVVVTLAIQLRYERHLKASFAHRRYIGFLAPLERVFPSLHCIFADYLVVKRILHGILIFFTVLLLILFAVLDIGQLSVIRNVAKSNTPGSDIIQVIDPRVGCNGAAAYCGMRANEIIWACTHNSHSSLDDGFVLPDHYYNITHQLNAGVRSFMVDVWYDKIDSSVSDEEDVYVCHTLCLMGRRLWRDVAAEFTRFLEKYPEQIIMIIFEQYVNSSDLGTISDEVGMTKYVWYSDQVAPNYNPDYLWPTLQELVNTNQRAMMFNDLFATSAQSKNAPTWLYYSFDFQYENYYNTPSIDDWECDIHRGWCTPNPRNVTCSESDSTVDSGCEIYPSSSTSSSGPSQAYLKSLDITNCTLFGADPLWVNGSAVYNAKFRTNPPNVRSKMSTMNHFITNGAASPVQATKANRATQVQSTTYMCASTWNTVVNILAFDFWNVENPLGTIEAMNRNLARYGSKYEYKDHWSQMLFGTATVSFMDDTT